MMEHLSDGESHDMDRAELANATKAILGLAGAGGARNVTELLFHPANFDETVRIICIDSLHKKT